MQVAFFSYTPNPELTIAAAARASSSNTRATEFLSKLTPQRVRDLAVSYTQQSQRHVSLKKLDYVTPSIISHRPQIEAKYQDQVMTNGLL